MGMWLGGWGPQEMHGELGVNCLWDNLLVLIIMYGGEIWSHCQSFCQKEFYNDLTQVCLSPH